MIPHVTRFAEYLHKLTKEYPVYRYHSQKRYYRMPQIVCTVLPCRKRVYQLLFLWTSSRMIWINRREKLSAGRKERLF